MHFHFSRGRDSIDIVCRWTLSLSLPGWWLFFFYLSAVSIKMEANVLEIIVTFLLLLTPLHDVDASNSRKGKWRSSHP